MLAGTGAIMNGKSVAVVSGSQSYTSPGTYTFTIPNYNSLSWAVKGGTGGGTFYSRPDSSTYNETSGTNGSSSTLSGGISATGAGGAAGAGSPADFPVGSSGCIAGTTPSTTNGSSTSQAIASGTTVTVVVGGGGSGAGGCGGGANGSVTFNWS
jgi:hypothetical protein